MTSTWEAAHAKREARIPVVLPDIAVSSKTGERELGADLRRSEEVGTAGFASRDPARSFEPRRPRDAGYTWAASGSRATIRAGWLHQ